MGTLLQFPLNGTDNTGATVGNTGATSVSLNSGNTATLLSAAAVQGSTGLRLAGGGTSAAAVQWNFASPNKQTATSVFVRIPSTGIPATSTSLVVVYTGSTVRVVDLVSYRTDGSVKCVDAGNTVLTLLTAAQATPGAYFRFECVVGVGSSTSNGTISISVYDTSGTKIGSTVTSSTANLGTDAQACVRALLSATVACTFDIDSLQILDGGMSEIGAYSPVTLVPPTASVTSHVDIVNASTSTANNGGTLSYAISPSAGVSTLAPGIWQTPIPAAGSPAQTYTVTVTETVTGQTAASTGTATVAAATSTQTFFSKVRAGGAWT
jgi:hypothetical protein